MNYFILTDKKVFRGCLSDPKDPRFLCELANTYKNATCLMCHESGCNSEPKLTPAKLSCVKCNDENECAFGQRSTKLTACKNDVEIGSEETCFTQTKPSNIHIFLFLF